MNDPNLVGSITGLTKASWGTVGFGDSCSHGVIYKATLRRAGEDDKIFSGSGFTTGVIFFDDADEVDLELLALDSAALPARGDILAVGSGQDVDITAAASGADSDMASFKGIIFDAEKAWEYKGMKMITLKASQFVNLAYPA